MTTTDPRKIAEEYRITLTEDRPLSGMWHCGPNAAWVEVTHLPTMISARSFDKSQHHARQAAMACCQMMVEQTSVLKCQFPERLEVRRPEPTADVVEAVARAMAPVVFEPFDPKKHGSPANQQASKKRWIGHARAGIDVVAAIAAMK